jgi:hypothetical protein
LRWNAGRPGAANDAIVIPIIYSYGHGIELALKAGIREAAGYLRGDGVADPDIQTGKIGEWMSATHSIGQLVDRLTRLLGQLQLGPGQQLPPRPWTFSGSSTCSTSTVKRSAIRR